MLNISLDHSTSQILNDLCQKYSTISNEIAQWSSLHDEKYITLLNRLKKLEPIVILYQHFKDTHASLEDFIALNKITPLDQSYLEECAKISDDLQGIRKQLINMLNPDVEDSIDSLFMEIRAGVGGLEAGLFCTTLSEMYLRYFETKKWKNSIISLAENEFKGYREIIIKVEGLGAYEKLKFESGVHRVQRVPETESKGRVHTSTVTIAIIPAYKKITSEDIILDPKDLRIDTMRSSGAGGQHVNKTDSAVRIVHLPTGIKAECQNDRSQLKNKEEALEILRARIFLEKKREQEDNISQHKLEQMGTGARSSRIRTYNYPQQRVTDHRLNKSYSMRSIYDILPNIIEDIFHADKEKLRR